MARRGASVRTRKFNPPSRRRKTGIARVFTCFSVAQQICVLADREFIISERIVDESGSVQRRRFGASNRKAIQRVSAGRPLVGLQRLHHFIQLQRSIRRVSHPGR